MDMKYIFSSNSFPGLVLKLTLSIALDALGGEKNQIPNGQDGQMAWRKISFFLFFFIKLLLFITSGKNTTKNNNCFEGLFQGFPCLLITVGFLSLTFFIFKFLLFISIELET